MPALRKAVIQTLHLIIFFVVLICSSSCFFPGNTKVYSIDYNLEETIIADHTVVDKYTTIPDAYITEVKKMWINIVGESHSKAYRAGLTALKDINSNFAAFAAEDPTYKEPEAYTVEHLRTSSFCRSPSAWQVSTGDYIFWTTPGGITTIKNHVDYCESHNLHITAIGFGWCYDMVRGNPNGTADPVFGCQWYGSTKADDTGWWGLDAEDSSINCLTYCRQVDDYNDYCKTKGYTTRFIFTTGTVDNESYKGDRGYQGFLKNDYIRNYVKSGDKPRILFDYADILAYNDQGAKNTTTWNSHVYPFIHDDNLKDNSTPDTSIGHIGKNGAIRLAKAQWWLLARMAGWDGKP